MPISIIMNLIWDLMFWF